METLTKKTRLDYLDLAKCIGIFLVIWGHTTGNFDYPLYRVVLYAFHMPLFFLVSGVVISRRQHEYNWAHWKAFLTKNIMALLVPYLIWGAIYSNFNFINIGKLFYGSVQVLYTAETLSSLWFLPCLFAARVMAEFVLMISCKVKKIEHHLFAAITAVVAFAIAFLLPDITIGYPLGLDVAFAALGFILIGYAAKDFLLEWSKRPIWVHLVTMVVCIAVLFFGIWVQGDNPYLVIMCKGEYGNIPLFFINSIAGTGAVLSLAMILARAFENHTENKVRLFMLWVGQNTIGIFLMHKPFLWEVVMPTLEKCGAQLPNAWWALLGTVVTFIYSIIMVWIINRYVPWLFGRYPKPKPKKEPMAEDLSATQ